MIEHVIKHSCRGFQGQCTTLCGRLCQVAFMVQVAAVQFRVLPE